MLGPVSRIDISKGLGLCEGRTRARKGVLCDSLRDDQADVAMHQAWRRAFRRNKSIFQRAHWYGRFIKRVACHSEDDGEWSQESAVGLLMHLPDDIRLLPNIRSFNWTEYGPSASTSLLNARLFAHSGLQELVLNMALADCEPLADILGIVATQCPRLATLRLAGDVDMPLDVAASAALAGLVRRNELVRFACTSPLFEEVLLAVTQSTSLKQVAIKLSWESLDSMTLHLLPSRCFPSVQDLSLRFEVLDASSLALLKRITSDMIVNLALHVMSEVYDDDLLIEHLKAIADAPFAPTLRKFELHAWRTETLSDADDSQPCAVTLNTLRPLLGLNHLSNFIVYARNFSLASRDIRTIASAFPNLHTLELTPSLILGTEPPAESMLHLAELCPRLVVLTLPVTTMFGIPSVDEGWTSKSRVTKYTVVTSQEVAGDPRLSSYISTLFPGSSPDVYEASNDSGDLEEPYVVQPKRGYSAASPCIRAQS